jgi:hypothetical protein
LEEHIMQRFFVAALIAALAAPAAGAAESWISS